MSRPALPIGVLCLHRADFENRCELDELGFVLVGVMLTKQQLGSRRQLRAYPCGGPTAIAAVSLGQFGTTGERCVHGDLRNAYVHPLSQTFSVPALFPGRLRVCRVSRWCRFARRAGWRYAVNTASPGPPFQ